MLSVDTFLGKSFDEKKQILHTIVDPMAVSRKEFVKAQQILATTDLQEKVLDRMYAYIHELIVNQLALTKTKNRDILEKSQAWTQKYLQTIQIIEKQELIWLDTRLDEVLEHV